MNRQSQHLWDGLGRRHGEGMRDSIRKVQVEIEIHNTRLYDTAPRRALRFFKSENGENTIGNIAESGRR